MLSTSSLLSRLKKDFPQVIFARGDIFCWSPDKKTVFVGPGSGTESNWSLLHELSHALLEHVDYEHDIELIKKEVDAWHYAQTILATKYEVIIGQEYIENHLDTYRDWLHARSICPTCHQTGVQTKTSTYSCINCSARWNVNDARTCALRRYVAKVV